MPHSLVLNLIPRTPIYPDFLTGRHLHALFLTLVNSVDPELAGRLHSQPQFKPFTLSPLQKQSPQQRLSWQHQHPIAAGTPCWWRISLLDEALFERLTELWLHLNPEQPWHLGSADLLVSSVLATPQSTQPWANSCLYTQLWERASPDERDLSLEFCTPTAFRQGKFDSALPTRDCVFGSLLQRWNTYSDRPIEATVLEHLFPSFFEIRAEQVKDSRSKFIGCVGRVTYKILGDLDPEVIQQLNTLADFALYAGVGRKTPMGMGMVRRRFRNAR